MRILEILANGRKISTNSFYSALIVNLLIGFSASLKHVDPMAELRFECHEQRCSLLCQGEPIELKPFVESLLADVTMTLILRLNEVDPDDRVEFFIGPDTDLEVVEAE